MVALILLLLALLCFLLAAFNTPTPRVNCIGLGLAFLTFLWLLKNYGVA